MMDEPTKSPFPKMENGDRLQDSGEGKVVNLNSERQYYQQWVNIQKCLQANQKGMYGHTNDCVVPSSCNNFCVNGCGKNDNANLRYLPEHSKPDPQATQLNQDSNKLARKSNTYCATHSAASEKQFTNKLYMKNTHTTNCMGEHVLHPTSNKDDSMQLRLEEEASSCASHICTKQTPCVTSHNSENINDVINCNGITNPEDSEKNVVTCTESFQALNLHESGELQCLANGTRCDAHLYYCKMPLNTDRCTAVVSPTERCSLIANGNDGDDVESSSTYSVLHFSAESVSSMHSDPDAAVSSCHSDPEGVFPLDHSDPEAALSSCNNSSCGADSFGDIPLQVASTTLSPAKGATSDGDVDGFWKRSGGISDTDSNADVQSDLCESIESLLGAVSDLDLPGSSVHSEISDEAVEIGVDGKLLGKEESSRPASPTPEEVYTTPADEFVTSPSAYSTGSVTTHDYYPVAEEKPIGNVGVVYSWLRFSLFPCVPPTINFRVSDSAPLNIPPEIKKVLKWKSTTVTPVIVRRVLFNSGMRIVKRSRQWIGIWAKHMRAGVFKTLKDFQKFNHFPGTFQIGRKDTLWRNHYRLRSLHGRRCYDFVPTTYVIPADMKQLRQAWDKGSPQQMWIVKPPASARGSGIKVVHKFVQIPKIRPLVIQKYLAAPFLINGVKFDLRIYVYVTSFYPLRIYVYKEGLVRFASVTYSPCTRTVGDRYMHLTNYSVNRKSLTYTANEDMDACKGHKWSLKALWGYLAEQGHNTTTIWNSIVEIIIKTVISCETTVSTLTRLNLRNPYSCHELFGFDIILDNKLKPWLLEVNISPSLQSSSKLDVNIKGHMCKDLLNLAGIMIPPHLEKSFQASFSEKLGKDAGIAVDNLCFDKRLFRTMLSLEERAKQVAYAHMDRHEYLSTILDNLVPDDVRQLVLMEDERCRSGQYIRVFPTHTTYRYLKFFERPRYYNHLFDAWETRYHSAREEGIQRLVASCHQGMHLTVVPKESIKERKPVKDKLDNKLATITLSALLQSFEARQAIVAKFCAASIFIECAQIVRQAPRNDSSPKADLGRISNSSSQSSLRVRCCGRSATNRAFRRACRSARNLLARMRMPRPHLHLNSPQSLEGRIKSPPADSNTDTKSLGTPSTQTSYSRPLVALNRIQLIHRDDGLNTTPGNTWQSHEFIASYDSNVAKENAELKPPATTRSCGELGLYSLSTEKQRHLPKNGVIVQKPTAPSCCHRDDSLCSYHFHK